MRAWLLALSFFSAMAGAADLVIDVHRDAYCGCCKDWIKHLKASGFTVHGHVEADMATVKQRLGVPPQMASCHTGVINGQFVEGHVPASEILKLTRNSDLVGVAVPGMPVGAPGMEIGEQQDAYQVIGLDKQGATRVLADYPAR